MYYSKDMCYALHDWLSGLDKIKHISKELQGRANYSENRGIIFLRNYGIY